MNSLTFALFDAHGASHEVSRLLLALGLLLVAARAFGELARYFGMPTVLGELSAGILLGPALFGRVAPDLAGWIFPTSGSSSVVLSGLRTLAVTLFLLVAGLEVDLSRIARRGRSSFLVGAFGIAIPFGIGFFAANAAPNVFGFESHSTQTVFALFVATALSISALPVIAKTLMDLGLYRTDFGMNVIASAILDDLIGWILFAIILGLSTEGAPSPVRIALLTIGFAVLMLTLGRWIVHRTLPWVQAHTAWPGGVIAFAITFALVSAAVTDWIGIHAVFGAFLAGVTLGDSAHLRERTRETVGDFVSSFFAPIFFAFVGLHVDFVTYFDWQLVLAVLVIACVGKIVGCSIGARLAGIAPRESIALGFAMNARGSMEIILGMTAYQNGLIGERMLVALVFMALATSIMSGPAIQRALDRKRPVRFAGALSAKAFVRTLGARDERSAARELAQAAAVSKGLDAQKIEAAVAARAGEPTRVTDDVAALRCRIPGIEWPVVALGTSRAGVALAGGGAASIVFLVVTPENNGDFEADIVRDIENTLGAESLRAKILAARSYTELLALLRADLAAR